MKIIFYSFISLSVACFLLSNLIAKEKKDSYRLVRMTCYSMGWGTTTVNQQTPQSIIALPERFYDKIIISDRSYLIELQEHIRKLRPVVESVSTDIRTVCLLTTDKGTTDTLSFGNFNFCQYNSNYYYLTWDLFQTIRKKLPPDEDIDFWLQDDPSLKEQMIENGKK